MKNNYFIPPAINRFIRNSIWIDIFLLLIIIILYFIGWIFDFPVLRDFGFSFTAMRPLAAVGFLICTIALIFMAVGKNGKYLNMIPRLAGVFLVLIGMLTSAIYAGKSITGGELPGIENPFLNFLISTESIMPFLSGLNFLFIGLVIILLTGEYSQRINFAHAIIFFPAIVSYMVLVSYILGIYHLNKFNTIPLPLNSGIAFCLVCAVLLYLQPGSWIMKVFTSPNAGSQMARRLLPGIFLLPLIIGWFRIKGEETGVYTSDVGVALVAITYTILFIWMVWLTAHSVNKTDEARIMKEKQLSEAQRIAGIGSWEWDIKTGILHWSDQLYEIFGEIKGEFIPTLDEYFRHVHPEDREDTVRIVSEASAAGIPYAHEFRIIPGKGEIRHILAQAELLKDEENNVLKYIGTALDITERKKNEDAIRESEERFRLALKNAPVTIAGQDTDLRFIWNYNQRTVKSPDEVIGKTDRDLFSEEEAQQLIALKRLVLETGQEQRTAMWLSRNGRRLFLDIFLEPLRDKSGRITGVGIATVDLTELKLAEIALKEKEQRLKFHFENSPLAVVEWDANYYITEWSAEAEHLFGWTNNETIGKPIGSLNLILPEDYPIVENTMNRLSSGSERTVVSTNRNVTKDGKIIICTWFNSVLTNEYGEMASVMSLVLDITERKTAEEALRASEERFRSVLDHSKDLIYRLNLKTRKLEYISPSAVNVLGYTQDEMMEMEENESLKNIHPDDLLVVKKMLERVEKSGTARQEYRFKFKNGDYRWISNHMSLVRDKEGKPLYRDGNVRDITDMKKSELEIITAYEELALFNKAMVGRELRMIELKREINSLCAQVNRPPMYELENEEVQS